MTRSTTASFFGRARPEAHLERVRPLRSRRDRPTPDDDRLDVFVLRHLTRAGVDDAQTPGEDVVGRDEAGLTVAMMEAQRVGSDDIDSLSNSLSLSASQKERISAWMDWRKKSLEGLSETDKAAVEEAYETAIARELDREQREKYQEMKKGSTGVRLALVLQERSAETIQTAALSEALKSLGTEK